jgi:adenosine kinase
MKKYTNILVTGSMGYDTIMDFPSRFKEHLLPEKLHQINVSFVVNRMERQLGGTATNIAHSLALYKKNKVKLLASVGKDGDLLLEYMKHNGIDVSGVLVDKTIFSANGTVITDQDDNQIWGFYYGACEAAKDINLDDYAGKDSLLIISANHPKAFMNFQKQAIKSKIDYMYDPGMTLSWNTAEDLSEGVYNCKWLVGNDYEIARICKILNTSVKKIVKKGIRVITTLGGEGVRYQDDKMEYFVPAIKVEKMIDPTGAGDAWRAGFVTGVVQQLSIEESLRLGNATASYAVEMYGTANHNPSETALQKRADSLKKLTL